VVYVGTYCSAAEHAGVYNQRLEQLFGGVLPETHAFNEGVPPLSSCTACPCHKQEQQEQHVVDAACQPLSCKTPLSNMPVGELISVVKGTRRTCVLLMDKLGTTVCCSVHEHEIMYVVRCSLDLVKLITCISETVYRILKPCWPPQYPPK
jgi:hypothetical protein